MTGLELRRHVAAPPEKVFAIASDFARAPETIRGIAKLELLTDGPVGVGTRFRETRVFFKREAVEEMEVTAFDPPRGYSLGAESHGCRYLTEYRFEPSGDGTDVVFTFSATPLTTVAKVMCFLMKPMAKMMLKECAKDMDDIARAAESELATSQG